MKEIMIGTWAWGTGINGSSMIFGKRQNPEILKEAFNEAVKLGFYEELYREILIEKRKPLALGCLEERAVALYFDYHSPEGFLARLIREKDGLEEVALICFLLEKSAEYGLSDLQAKKLIRRYRAR